MLYKPCSTIHALIDAAACLCLLRFFRRRLGRVAVAAHGTLWIGRALVGDVAERSLVGLFSGLIGRFFLWRLILGLFPVSGHLFFLRVARPGQQSGEERDGHSGTESSHPYFLLDLVNHPAWPNSSIFGIAQKGGRGETLSGVRRCWLANEASGRSATTFQPSWPILPPIGTRAGHAEKSAKRALQRRHALLAAW